jgi:hypothetical protein
MASCAENPGMEEHDDLRRVGFAAFAVCLVLGAAVVAAGGRARAEDPLASWDAVGKALGVAGRVLPDGTYRVDVPRADPPLVNEFGFAMPPSMVLTYAAFSGAPSDATLVGDTCVLGEEVNPVLDALRAGSIEVVAIHNHMLGGTPNFIFLHFQGRGEAVALARTVRRAWDEMAKPHPLPERRRAAAPKLDWNAVSEAVGRPGTLQPDGMYKVGLPRPHLGTTLDGRPLPAGAIPACWAGFAPCECGLTMVMGDTCLLRSELQKTIDGYRRHGIRIVAIHNHTLGTQPELVFCHFAAEGEALELARAIRTVWEGLGAPK